MSKRFGRNQRRRLREGLAKAEKATAIWRDLWNKADTEAAQRAVEVRHLKYRIHEWDEEIKRLLGPHSAFRGGTTVHHFHGDAKDVRQMQVKDVPSFASMVSDMPVEEKMMVETVRRLEFEAETLRPDLKLYLRARVVGTKGDAAYVLSESLLRDVGIGERERQEIAWQIARSLTKHINGQLLKKEGAHEENRG
jgi:hypothetical protein